MQIGITLLLPQGKCLLQPRLVQAGRKVTLLSDARYNALFALLLPCICLKLEEEKRELSQAILFGLLTDTYSQMLSPYCLSRNLLPAAFQPWASTIFIIQSGHFRFI